jgi:hypothetical protein
VDCFYADAFFSSLFCRHFKNDVWSVNVQNLCVEIAYFFTAGRKFGNANVPLFENAFLSFEFAFRVIDVFVGCFVKWLLVFDATEFFSWIRIDKWWVGSFLTIRCKWSDGLYHSPFCSHHANANSNKIKRFNLLFIDFSVVKIFDVPPYFFCGYGYFSGGIIFFILLVECFLCDIPIVELENIFPDACQLLFFSKGFRRKKFLIGLYIL